jgi:hypothetical protein
LFHTNLKKTEVSSPNFGLNSISMRKKNSMGCGSFSAFTSHCPFVLMYLCMDAYVWAKLGMQ